MEILNNVFSLVSYLMFIMMTYHVLASVFDWTKLIKNTTENIGRLKVFILFLSIGIGYLVSHFILEVIAISQSIFFTIQ